MTLRYRKTILLQLLLLSYLLFSYNVFRSWWYSSTGTVLILLFSYLIWKKDFLNYIGLCPDPNIIARSMITAGIVLVCAFMIMKHIASRHDVLIQNTSWRNFYHIVFYTMNEEIVLGALILFWLTRRKKIPPLTAAVGLAVIFALVHYIFYRWLFKDNGIIGLAALLTLFFIGIVRNNLILITGHIGYSWALHCGWMVIMFGCFHYYKFTEVPLSEYERFNLYLGSTEMIIISFILATLSIFLLVRRPGISMSV
jgi:hypothetical protein